MLAADAELEFLPHLAAGLGGDTDEFPDALAVDRHEGVDRKNALRCIHAQKARRVVAADTKGGLRQVVGAEGKELGRLGDLAGPQCTEVSVAGKRNFQGRDKEAETALEIQGRRCRDKISPGNSANSGLIAGVRESALERECTREDSNLQPSGYAPVVCHCLAES